MKLLLLQKHVLKRADGVDFTSYRYVDGDPVVLTKAVVDAVGADKVCIAGSIGNVETYG